jgi:regulator of replication initiation timing
MSDNPTLVNDFKDVLTHISQLEHRILKLVEEKEKLIKENKTLIKENKDLKKQLNDKLINLKN